MACEVRAPELERHEVARQQVAPVPAEPQVRDAGYDLAKEAACARRLLLRKWDKQHLTLVPAKQVSRCGCTALSCCIAQPWLSGLASCRSARARLCQMTHGQT